MRIYPLELYYNVPIGNKISFEEFATYSQRDTLSEEDWLEVQGYTGKSNYKNYDDYLNFVKERLPERYEKFKSLGMTFETVIVEQESDYHNTLEHYEKLGWRLVR
jgi:vacuolar-type H+-ATPase subunit B/Vma2